MPLQLLEGGDGFEGLVGYMKEADGNEKCCNVLGK